jgi:hypothetical protein
MEHTVSITVSNMDGIGYHTETVDFTDFASLKERVESIIDELGYRKVDVDLSPSWDATDAEQEELNNIELG